MMVALQRSIQAKILKPAHNKIPMHIENHNENSKINRVLQITVHSSVSACTQCVKSSHDIVIRLVRVMRTQAAINIQ